MSDLVAIASGDEATATRARDNLKEALKAGAPKVDDVVVIAAGDDGRIGPILPTEAV
jgi:uncharacterized membrane protein